MNVKILATPKDQLRHLQKKVDPSSKKGHVEYIQIW